MKGSVIVKDEAAPWGLFSRRNGNAAFQVAGFRSFGVEANHGGFVFISNRGADRNEASCMNRNRSPASSFGIGYGSVAVKGRFFFPKERGHLDVRHLGAGV